MFSQTPLPSISTNSRHIETFTFALSTIVNKKRHRVRGCLWNPPHVKQQTDLTKASWHCVYSTLETSTLHQGFIYSHKTYTAVSWRVSSMTWDFVQYFWHMKLSGYGGNIPLFKQIYLAYTYFNSYTHFAVVYWIQFVKINNFFYFSLKIM